MQRINENGGGGSDLVVDRLEARTGAQARELADRSKAVEEHTTGHRDGSDAFRNVTLAVTKPDGKRVRDEAQPDAPTAPTPEPQEGNRPRR